MKHRFALLLAFALGIAVASLPALDSHIAWAAPGSTTTFLITLQGDEDYINNHEATAKRFVKLSGNVVSTAASVTKWTTKRDTLGDKVRDGLKNHRSALDALMPAGIDDMTFGYTDANLDEVRNVDANGEFTENDVVWMWLNGDAAPNRATPPAGIVVWP